LYKLQAILDGDLEELVKTLRERDQEESLAAVGAKDE
jgi:protein subunit release factor A